jgi:hypothetical protein
MHRHGRIDLMAVLLFPVFEPHQTMLATDIVRSELTRTVNGDEVVQVKKKPLLEFSDTLHLPKLISKRFIERLDIGAIKDGSHWGYRWGLC